MKRVFFLLISCLSIFIFVACDKKEDTNPNSHVNDWILEQMQTYYYWSSKLPSRTDKTLTPDLYFESLLNAFNPTTNPDGDRFSWIQDDWQELVSSLNGVASNEIGFDYVLYLKDDGGNNVLGQITYVKTGTPAKAAGIKRGMWFDRVGGTVLTKSNHQSLLVTTSAQITLGFLNENYNTDGTFSSFTTGVSRTIRTVSGYSENPILMDSIYVSGTHTVGYLVYNFFAPDGGSGNSSYDLALNSVFGKFKTAGVTDLVLDLRYNNGGKSSSAQLLASLIVPNLSESKIYTYYEFNSHLNTYYAQKYGSDFFNTYFTRSVMSGNSRLQAVNAVGDKLSGRVYVLTGPYTASASEQVINGLKPYMDVILIGDVTYGKNVASFSIYDETDKANKWGIQPIVAKYFNSLGKSDFTSGFTPDYEVSDAGLAIKPLGDRNEKLLKTALDNVFGLINNSAAVPQRDRIVQKNKLLRTSLRLHHGLQLDKMPFIE